MQALGGVFIEEFDVAFYTRRWKLLQKDDSPLPIGGKGNNARIPHSNSTASSWLDPTLATKQDISLVNVPDRTGVKGQSAKAGETNIGFLKRHGALFRYLGYLHIGLMSALLIINAFGGLAYYFLCKDMALTSGRLIYPAAAAIDIAGTGMVSWCIADVLTQKLHDSKEAKARGFDWPRLTKRTICCGALQILTHILYNLLPLIPVWCPWFALLPGVLQFGVRLACILAFGAGYYRSKLGGDVLGAR